jgi:hypothetical protein
LVDSVGGIGCQYSVFFVRMASYNPTHYVDSPVDSVCSSDNLSPAAPLHLLGGPSGLNASLAWGEVDESDLSHYWVYRGLVSGFPLDPSNRIGAVGDTSFLDTSVPGSPVFYRVTAVDFAGNESDPSNEARVDFGCSCPYQSDFDEDGFLTPLDLSSMIDILFAGAEDVQDTSCPSPRADFDCDGYSTPLDLGGLIDHLFASGLGPCDPCSP